MKKNEKEKIVNDLAEKFNTAKVIYLTDFSGLTVAAISDLRKQLKKESFGFKVIKNSFIRIAAERAGYKDLTKDLAGPTAVTVGSDPVFPAKTISKFAKDNGLIKLKVGVVEGKIVTAAEITKIGKLPTKDILLVQLVTTLNAPISNMVFTLKDILNKLARVINAIAEEKKKNS
jgi:large subunit ribosomal protein L10